ncbi:MAG: Glu-tRNA(Gln) amidotransferase subunit GatD [Desulfurococcaceae archaeon]
MLIYHGYMGEVATLLEAKGIRPGDRVSIKTRDGGVLQGLLMPRPFLYGGSSIIIIKLDSGYNVGIKLDKIESIELVKRAGEKPKLEKSKKQPKLSSPRVALISTGGTIASRVDYETGAVTPTLTPEEIVEWIPELEDVALITAREAFSIFSEDMTPQLWGLIAKEVYKEVKSGVNGVVVAHGTDTMSFSASALAFAIQNKPVPIVFVGAQRSSDRPSTDAASNLIAAVLVATKAPFAESVISMHGLTSDEYALVHRGVKVRKMHTSRRDAFQSINDMPLAAVNIAKQEIKVIGTIYEHRDESKEPNLIDNFDDRVALVKTYPGIQQEIVDFLVDKGFHGIVIEGTGLGHAPNKLVESIKRATEQGIPVVMTSQCIFGRVNLNVYSTGRYLLEVGVIPASDMLSETAFVKLSWILGSITRNVDEIRELFLKNMVGEINERHVTSLYPRWVYE